MAKKPVVNIKTYLFHKLANMYRLMNEQEFAGLVNSIKERGQIDEGILFEGKILDGRNRYNACIELKIPFKCKEFSGNIKEAIMFVEDKNEHRRHLSKAEIVEKALLELDEERKKMTLESKVGKKSKLNSAERVALRHPISTTTLEYGIKIVKVAKEDEYIAKKWEEAKRGELTVNAVYEKVKILESIKDLPKEQKYKIKKEIAEKEKTVKQIKADVQDIKDNIKRAEIAKKSRESEKSKEEREKAHLKIRKLENTIIELKGAIKSSDAKITVLSNETFKKYPEFKSANPDKILTNLDKYYDTLDVKVFDMELKELKTEYEELMKPLYEKIKEFEGKYSAKKDVLIKQKKERNAEVEWIDNMQNNILSEYDRRDMAKESIEKYIKEIKELKDRHLIS